MGKHISFYVIDKDNQHTKDNGTMCLDLEFQHDNDDVVDMLDCRLYNHAPKRKICDYDKRYQIECLNICPKCKMFMVGIHGGNIKDSLHIHHNYSNPIWTSDYNIQDLSLGSSTTTFVKLFRNDMQYYEIFESDVKRGYAYLEQLGTPKRTSDKEAYDETMQVMRFLERWVDNDTVYIIMEEEYV
jgi:hypothetical protein